MKTILIIEDEPEMRRNLATILEMEGYKVFAAEDGKLGVDLARAERPDLILCDVMMPELNGHAVLALLQKDQSTSVIPFIFLTAKGEKSDFRFGMNLGADDYLTKPVSTEELLRAIDIRFKKRGELEASAARPVEFRPRFESPQPLQALGLTPREAEVLFWVAQGKSNPDVAVILEASEGTVKKHLEHVYAKLSVENRNAATLRALEVLNAPHKTSIASP